MDNQSSSNWLLFIVYHCIFLEEWKENNPFMFVFLILVIAVFIYLDKKRFFIM
jgi:hypothetical protein